MCEHLKHKLIDLTHGLSPSILALHITDNADFEEKVKTAGFQKMPENKNFLDRIFNPSAAEKIMEASNYPVLVFHAKS